jgi:hypothetical protein
MQMDSVFRVLEPVVGHINERSRAPASLSSRLGLKSQRSDWFRTYREFFLPSESYDLVFLKARIAVLCARGFEIMDLTDFKSVTIPQRDDPRLEKLAKRCDSCRPLGMFRSNADEFLLCYDGTSLSFSNSTILTDLHRIRPVRRPARRPFTIGVNCRMGGHRRTCRAPSTLRPPLRLALHRSPARRNRQARADHPG